MLLVACCYFGIRDTHILLMPVITDQVFCVSSHKSTLLFISDRMRFLNCMGNFVQVQPGCDGLEHCLSRGQLSALILSPVQAQAGEFFICMPGSVF